MSDDVQAPEAGATEPTTETPAQPDLSNIQEVIDGRLGALEQSIQQALQQRQEPQAEEDPYADVYGYANDLGLNVPQAQAQEDDTATLQALAQLGDQRAQRLIDERVSPQMQAMERRLQEMQARDDMRELQQQYPKLTDPAVEQAITAKLSEIIQDLPPGVPVSKTMVGLAYRAWEADQMATDEGSVRQQHNQLENPAGAGPEGSELSWSDRMLQGTQQSKGASFWGF